MSQKNFMSYGDAESVLSEFADSINSKEPQIFKGTSAEWENLTPAEQAGYSVKCITDDESGNVVDAVTDGDMRAVTSNAVYDKVGEYHNDFYQYYPTIIESAYANATEGTLFQGGTGQGAECGFIGFKNPSYNYTSVLVFNDRTIAHALIQKATGKVVATKIISSFSA